MILAHVENIGRYKYTVSKKKDAKWGIPLRQDFFCKINDNFVSIPCLHATVQVACNSSALHGVLITLITSILNCNFSIFSNYFILLLADHGVTHSTFCFNEYLL